MGINVLLPLAQNLPKKLWVFIFFLTFLLFLPEIISEMETFHKCSNTSKTILESFREQESIFGEEQPCTPRAI